LRHAVLHSLTVQCSFFIVQSFCSLVVFTKFSWCACFVCFMFLCSIVVTVIGLLYVLLCCHVRRNKDTHIMLQIKVMFSALFGCH